MVIVGMQSTVAQVSGEGTAATRHGASMTHLIDRVTHVEMGGAWHAAMTGYKINSAETGMSVAFR